MESPDDAALSLRQPDLRQKPYRGRFFGFKFRFEAYMPKHKRQYGPYVLSVLRGDRLIARVDPLLDRKGVRLLINAVHVEPGAPNG